MPGAGLAFVFIELCEVLFGTFLQLVKASVNASPALQCISQSPWLGVICKLAEGAFHPLMQDIDKNVEQHWTQC